MIECEITFISIIILEIVLYNEITEWSICNRNPV